MSICGHALNYHVHANVEFHNGGNVVTPIGPACFEKFHTATKRTAFNFTKSCPRHQELHKPTKQELWNSMRIIRSYKNWFRWAFAIAFNPCARMKWFLRRIPKPVKNLDKYPNRSKTWTETLKTVADVRRHANLMLEKINTNPRISAQPLLLLP